MSDAIALFKPKDPSKLVPFLDLDDGTESDGLYAEALEDGAYLVHTFQPFEAFATSPDDVDEWLAQFGEALPLIHDDERGLLVFSDEHEPEATTYEAVVAEVADKGVWLDLGGEDLPAIDMEALQAFAGQLMGGADGQPGKPVTSFEVGRMFQGMQEQLIEALGIDLEAEKKKAKDDE